VQDKPWLASLYHQLDYTMPLHNLLYFVAIIFFCYFYISIIFNPMDVADNMKEIRRLRPGNPPGRRTAEYLDEILTRLTFVGAIYLAMIALLPQILISGLNIQALPLIGPTLDAWLPAFLTQGLGLKFYFGGTSLPDRRRRRHGHGAADRIAAHHEALRRLLEGGEDAAAAAGEGMSAVGGSGARLVLLGAPGVGKGTQAAEISRRTGLPHISTGDLLRAAIREGSPLGRRVAATVERGSWFRTASWPR